MIRTPLLIAAPLPPLIELYSRSRTTPSDDHRISIFAGIGLHPPSPGRRERNIAAGEHQMYAEGLLGLWSRDSGAGLRSDEAVDLAVAEQPLTALFDQFVLIG